MQTWQKALRVFTLTRCISAALQKSSGSLEAHSSPHAVLGMWQLMGSPKASVQEMPPSAFPHIHAQARVAYVGWWSTCQLAVSSSAEVCCVDLELKSSGVCRSNDTITVTGILAPRVEIRHHFFFVARWVQQKTGSVARMYIAKVPTGCIDLIGCEITQSVPADVSSPSCLTQHPTDATERE